jgi:hypothetical protein
MVNVGNRGRIALLIAVTGTLGLTTAPARGDDSREALDELRQGYSLKQLANCRDALPHLARSVHLDPSPRALLNLSDCEQQLGELVEAQAHAAQGRELARHKGDAELVTAADGQLESIAKRLPRLTVRLASTAPLHCVVASDGAVVEAASLGLDIGVNPGAHAFTVSAPGYAERRFDVSIEEGARKEVEVEPGAKLQADAPPAAPSIPATTTGRGAPEGVPTSTSPNRTLAYSVLAFGAAGVIVGVVTGFAAGSKHSTLAGECDPQGGACPPGSQGDIDSFHTLRTASTVAYAIGAAGVVGGAVLWFIAPSPRSHAATAHVWLGPASAGIAGRF